MALLGLIGEAIGVEVHTVRVLVRQTTSSSAVVVIACEDRRTERVTQAVRKSGKEGGERRQGRVEYCNSDGPPWYI